VTGTRTSPRANAPGQRRARALARRVVDVLGGRYSVELGIDVDRDAEEIERWALAATLFGGRISTKIAQRTFAVLNDAGVHTIADAGREDVERLIDLLDAGGYARYDLQTAARLHAIAERLQAAHRGRVASALGLPLRELEGTLDALPGWGPVTVGLFLRELRGVDRLIDPPLDQRTLAAGEHLGLLRAGGGDSLTQLRALADAAGIDPRDLEAALVRLSLAHGRHMLECPGGERCTL
jgi:hypothetical protein